jgi:hypothetical protein
MSKIGHTVKYIELSPFSEAPYFISEDKTMTFNLSHTRLRLFRLLTALLLTVAPLLSFAGSQTGKVKYITVRWSDGLVYFYLEGSGFAKPACASQPYWIIKNENSVAGKQQHATLLAAKLSGQTISVDGWNQCTRWVDGEDVDSIRIND